MSHRILDWLHRIEEGLLMVLMGVMILVATAHILVRNLFEVTILWADPLIRLLVLWTSFLGALLATRLDKHIKIDVLLRFVSPKLNRGLLAISGLFSALVCAVLTWVAVRFLLDEYAFPAEGALGLPTWVLQLIFPFTFGLMACRFTLQMFQHLAAFFKGTPS